MMDMFEPYLIPLCHDRNWSCAHLMEPVFFSLGWRCERVNTVNLYCLELKSFFGGGSDDDGQGENKSGLSLRGD